MNHRRSKGSHRRKLQQPNSHSKHYMTQFPIFARFHSDPLSSAAPSINVVRIQRQAETRSQSGDGYYTMRSSSVRPRRQTEPRFEQQSTTRTCVGLLARLLPSIGRGMSQSWWLIIGRGKSRRYVVLSASSSRIMPSAEMRSATCSCRRVRSSTTKAKRERRNKRKNERKRMKPWKRDSTHETGRWTNGQAGGQRQIVEEQAIELKRQFCSDNRSPAAVSIQSKDATYTADQSFD